MNIGVQTLYELVCANNVNNVRNHKRWELFEDEEMLKAIFQIEEIDPRDIISLESVVPSDFKMISQKLERSIDSCSTHWDKILLPILKTHLKRLPLGSEWKNDLMDYVIKHKTDNLRV